MHTMLEEELIFLLLFFSLKCQKILLSDTVSDLCKECLLFTSLSDNLLCVNCFMHCRHWWYSVWYVFPCNLVIWPVMCHIDIVLYIKIIVANIVLVFFFFFCKPSLLSSCTPLMSSSVVITQCLCSNSQQAANTHWLMSLSVSVCSAWPPLHTDSASIGRTRRFRMFLVNLLGFYLILFEGWSGFCSETGEFDLLQFSI